MKISFSTLGCPGWFWEDVVVTAKDLGFDGIEIRGVENELYVPAAKPFTGANLKATVERLKKLKLEVPCLASSCYLFDKSANEEALKEGRDYIDLAHALGASYVRVLGDKSSEPGEDVDTDFVAENLKKLSDYAQGKNVMLLVETNGVFANSEKLMKLIHSVNRENVGILWDIHHPYRFMNESIEFTYQTLEPHIKHVHVKDSVMENGRICYKMVGYGDIPVKDMLLLLKKKGYAGYISLEWVKRWCADLEDPGVVFPHFANYIQDILK